jgi:non-ribosomal peptide synthetase component F
LAAPRSIEMVVGLVGILKSGAAYLPLDPEYPLDRLTYMLEDARPAALLTVAAIVPHLPPFEGHRLVLDGPEDLKALTGCRAHSPASSRLFSLDPRHPAYIIYTSGSTGRPKAVVNTHAGIVNRLCWMQGVYGLTAADRVLQKTPYSFDVSVWEFFWPLLTGATLVLARPDGHRDPAYLSLLIRREKITTVHFVPSMLRAFLSEPSAAQCTSLRRVIASGEALPGELQADFERVLKVPLHNLYGPTEAAVDVSYWECPRDR